MYLNVCRVKMQIHAPDFLDVLDTHATWVHGQFPSKGAYFRPLLCLRTQSITIWRMRLLINLHLFYNFAVGGIWIRLLCSFSFFVYHRAWTRKTAVLVLLSASLALGTSSALKLLNCNATKDFKNKLFSLIAQKKKIPGNKSLKLRIEITCKGIYL